MKNYQGRDLFYQPSKKELEKRKKATTSTKYEEYIYEQKCYFGGWQTKYRFENGYGASVINNNGSYGIELEVICFEKDGVCSILTRKIIPFISNEEELEKILKRIKEY